MQSCLLNATSQCAPHTAPYGTFQELPAFTLQLVQELASILLHPDVDRHFGVPLNCVELASSMQHLEIVQELVADPQGTMAVLDESLRLAQEHVVSEQDDSDKMSIKVHS